MNEIKDFKCTYDNSIGIHGKMIKDLQLKVPEAYLEASSLVLLSKALKEREDAVFCEMPFDHTVEAEALGGKINLGDEKAGPRASEYVCQSLEELLLLPNIDYSKGRIHEVLLACEKLNEQGETVVLEISGPFTILNTLIDLKYIFRGLRKTPELMKQIFEKIEEELFHYVKEAEKHGVRFISYADPAGGVGIIGPKMAEQMVELFTYDFVKRSAEITERDTMLLLCPKTSFALIGAGKARFSEVELGESLTYQSACLGARGTVKIAGQMCMKNIGFVLKDKKLKKVELL